jgi:hypothetical protein
VASFVYQAVLRGELTRELGVAWTPVRDGIAEVDGVPGEVMRVFSRRRVQIEAALAERGTDGARAAEAAALATRRGKGAAVGVEALEAEWRQRAAEVDFRVDDVYRLLGRASARGLEAPTLAALRHELAGRRGLTQRRSSFGRRDVLLELCERLPVGVTVTARELEGAADDLLASSRVVPLVRGRDVDTDDFRRRAGRRLPLAVEERRYSTPELLAVEQRLVDRVRRARRRGPTAARTVDAAIAARPSLSDEQRAMVRHLCERADAVAVVSGKAGTGKTFALGAAREAGEAAGFPVRGAAVALRAARELEDGRASRPRPSPRSWPGRRCRRAWCSSSMRPAWSVRGSWRRSWSGSCRCAARSCLSGTIGSCLSSKLVACSVPLFIVGSPWNFRRTAARSRHGSDRLSTTCVTAALRRRSRSTAVVVG